MMDFKLEPVQFTLLTYYCIINITAAVLTVTESAAHRKSRGVSRSARSFCSVRQAAHSANLSPCCVSATKQST